MGIKQWWAEQQPWTCPACGKRRIRADKQGCPKCGLPRVGSPADRTGIYMAAYADQKKMQKGIEQLAKGGWKVENIQMFQSGAGLGAAALLGGDALLLGRRAHIMVTYKKQTQTQTEGESNV